MQKIANQKHIAELNQRHLFHNVSRVRNGDRVAIAAMSVALLLGACGKPKMLDEQINRAVAVTGAVSVVSSAAVSESHMSPVAMNFILPRTDFTDDRSSARSTTLVASLFDTVFGKPAAAEVSDCRASASSDTCSADKTKKASYQNCAIGTSGLHFSGTIELEYSNPSSCALTEVNQTISRTATIEREALLGNKIYSTTKTSENYLGEDIGGGSRIKKTEKGYALRIMGQHMRRVDSSGESVADISVRSSVDMSMSNPTGNPIIVDGGMLEVFNNQGKFMSRMVADQLYYDTNQCCYPMRGSFDVTFVGQAGSDASAAPGAAAETGDDTGKISFGPACGEVTLEQGGQTIDLEVPDCR